MRLTKHRHDGDQEVMREDDPARFGAVIRHYLERGDCWLVLVLDNHLTIAVSSEREGWQADAVMENDAV